MPGSPERLRASVLERFNRTAESPECETRFPIGPASAKKLGYDAEEIDALPPAVTDSFCGVGHPIGLRELRPGQVVLDLGSGAGMDAILAARRVGGAGAVIGVDMTPAMIDKARRNALAVGATSIEFRQGRLEALPVEDESIDVVITNGVFNLSLEKERAVSEMFRVLRPGGRLQMADILLHEHVTPDEVATKGEWSD
jgi:SAM-dependent methyltransferase